MAPRTITYRVEVTTFAPAPKSEVHDYDHASKVASFVCSLPIGDRVIFVAALDLDNGVDYGNFYIFSNAKGAAHVMVHEHREFLPRDPLAGAGKDDVKFLDEDANSFAVPHELTTSIQRGIAALEHWLPGQEHWPEFQWQ